MKNILRKKSQKREVNLEKFFSNLSPFLKGKIGFFYPLEKEMDLFPFVKNKNIYLPCAVGGTLIYKKYVGILKKAIFNTMEATGEVISKNELDVIIIPCLAANRSGYRVGYGKGYYDRFLKDYQGITVGCCFSENLTTENFSEENDVRLNFIVTEKEVIKCTI